MIAFNPENNSWCSFPLSVLFMDKTQQQQQKNPKNHIETLTSVRTHRLFLVDSDGTKRRKVLIFVDGDE